MKGFFASCFLKRLSVSTIKVTAIATGVMVVLPSQATTLSSASTTGHDMAGMEITVNFFGGGSETTTWTATSSIAGKASGTNWSLTQSDNTFSSPWMFNYSGSGSVASLVINAIPGNATFDIISGLEVTPGSGNGKPLTTLSGEAPNSFNYSVPIDISLGDLFGTLALTWDKGFTGMVSFLADTDSGTTNNPVTINPKPVPEPASVVGLLAASAFGASSTWKRKQKQKA